MKKILYPSQSNYLNSFRKKSDRTLKEMEEYAKKNKVPILSWQGAEFIEQLVQISKPKRVLEIGMAIAYTSIRIARLLNDNSFIETIEISRDNIAAAKKNIAKAGLKKKIKILEGNALEIIPNLKSKYDMIFLDADKEDYLDLFNLSISHLRKGGLFIVDNLLWQGYAASSTVPSSYRWSTKKIREFNNNFIIHKNLNTTILPIGDGIGLGVKI